MPDADGGDQGGERDVAVSDTVQRLGLRLPVAEMEAELTLSEALPVGVLRVGWVGVPLRVGDRRDGVGVRVGDPGGDADPVPELEPDGADGEAEAEGLREEEAEGLIERTVGDAEAEGGVPEGERLRVGVGLRDRRLQVSDWEAVADRLSVAWALTLPEGVGGDWEWVREDTVRERLMSERERLAVVEAEADGVPGAGWGIGMGAGVPVRSGLHHCCWGRGLGSGYCAQVSHPAGPTNPTAHDLYYAGSQ